MRPDPMTVVARRIRAAAGAAVGATVGALLLAGCLPQDSPTETRPVHAVLLQLDHATLVRGDSGRVAAVAVDDRRRQIPGKAFTFGSEAESVVTVDAAGMVRAVGVGPAQVTATVDGVTGRASVVVTRPVVHVVTVTPAQITVAVGTRSAPPTVALHDASGRLIPDAVARWESPHPEVAAIDPASGVVTGVAVGESWAVAVSESDRRDSARVTVVPRPVATVVVSPAAGTVEENGGTLTLAAHPLDADGNALTDRVVAWTSAAPLTASVAADGVVTGHAAGTVLVTAEVEGVADTAEVAVVAASVRSIAVALSADTLVEGQSLLVRSTAALRDGRGNPLVGREVAWSSADERIVTVGRTSGTARAAGAGETYVRATSEGVTDSARIRVLPAVRRVEVGAPDVRAGSTTRLTATLRDASGAVLAGRPVAWAVERAGIASVHPGTGDATGLAHGQVVVTATSEGATGSATLRVLVAWRAIAVGSDHVCALTVTDEAYCWGSNEHGQLGVPAASVAERCGGVVCVHRPRRLADDPSLRFREIAVGGGQTCGITTSGATRCWGRAAPSGLGGVAFRGLSLGGRHGCALSDDVAYCWGANPDGQLGTGRVGVLPQPDSAPSPREVLGRRTYAQLTAGGTHSCGHRVTGELECWGSNQRGQLGTGGGGDICRGPLGTTQCLSSSPVPVGAGRYDLVTAGGVHSCALAGGRASCWGANQVGQLGVGATSPWEDRPRPVAGHTFRALTAGDNITCGIATAGTTLCWGHVVNAAGQLGPRAEPTPVPEAPAFSTVDAGASFACGLTGAGAIYCWGLNFRAQHGVGPGPSVGVPRAVGEPPLP